MIKNFLNMKGKVKFDVSLTFYIFLNNIEIMFKMKVGICNCYIININLLAFNPSNPAP